jgi:hypothetical protein
MNKGIFTRLPSTSATQFLLNNANVNIVTHSGLSITHGATNEDETDGSLPTSALQRHTHSKGK